MVHLSENGMPFIKLFNQVVFVMDRTPRDLLGLLSTNLTVQGIKTLCAHMEYIEKEVDVKDIPSPYKDWISGALDKSQYTWPWARIINQEAFKSYHKSNILLLCRLASILEASDTSNTATKMAIFDIHSSTIADQRSYAFEMVKNNSGFKRDETVNAGAKRRDEAAKKDDFIGTKSGMGFEDDEEP